MDDEAQQRTLEVIPRLIQPYHNKKIVGSNFYGEIRTCVYYEEREDPKS